MLLPNPPYPPAIHCSLSRYEIFYVLSYVFICHLYEYCVRTLDLPELLSDCRFRIRFVICHFLLAIAEEGVLSSPVTSLDLDRDSPLGGGLDEEEEEGGPPSIETQPPDHSDDLAIPSTWIRYSIDGLSRILWEI